MRGECKASRGLEARLAPDNLRLGVADEDGGEAEDGAGAHREGAEEDVLQHVPAARGEVGGEVGAITLQGGEVGAIMRRGRGGL